MITRKVQEIKGTYFVTLPKKWAQKSHVEKGKEVYLSERQDGSLVVTPSELGRTREELEASVTYPMDIQAPLRDVVISLYLSGYDTIRIGCRNEELPTQERENLLTLVKKLAGIEVMEEDKDKMVLHCVLDPFSMNPKLILRRMGFIVSNMLRGLSRFENNENLHSIVLMDDELDRAYFLLVRLLRSSLRRPKLAEEFELKPVDYLDYRVAAAVVESIGDRISDSAEASMSNISLNEAIRTIAGGLSENAIQAVTTSLETFLNNDYKKVQQAKSIVDQFNGFSEGKNTEGLQGAHHGEALSVLRFISESCRNIIDLISYEGLVQQDRTQ